MNNVLRYQAHAHWTMHKRGILEANEIPRTINFAAPPEFGGEPGLWTPEHLLLGSVITCYVSTFRAIAEKSKLEFPGLDVFAEGVVQKQDGVLRFTEIVLRPVITLASEKDQERAERLIEKAERICLISRSLSCNVSVRAELKTGELLTAG
jgi:peroxiredoxin-like protein